jgi:hypothetical protein
MDAIWLRTAQKLNYQDPEHFLRRLRSIENAYSGEIIDPNDRALRTNELKKVRETREAALFCHGMSAVLGVKVLFAPSEASDYDFIAAWVSSESCHFVPVQLKELVPSHRNASTSLEDLISSLDKYPSSAGLAVAIHLNRPEYFNPDEIKISHAPVAEIWMFGALSEDQSQWGIWGDFLRRPSGTRFAYPT